MCLPTDFSPQPTEIGIITLNVQVWIAMLREVKRIAREVERESLGWGLSTDALAALGCRDLAGFGLLRVP